MFIIRQHLDGGINVHHKHIGPFINKDAAQEWLTNLEDALPELYAHCRWQIFPLSEPIEIVEG